ncbi:MAG: hypothetical protein CL927_06045 [Deltaproteobacteria bacterium]|nr:hypothetical protein [Deltaproteobacteria bacterium]HCH65930.1 hypothetical protein [Deltaproteobacteria bacterium]
MAPLGLLLGLLAGAPADAAPVQIANVTASGTKVSDDNGKYDPKHVTDGKQQAFWVEGGEGSGLGSWVQLNFAAPTNVTGLRIWNGSWYSYDFWERHSRVKEVELEFSDGTKQKMDLQNEKRMEEITLPKAVQAEWVKVKIKSVYSGNTFNDTGISEIQVLDDKPNAHVPVAAWTSSSVYPEDADGNYQAVNVQDGLADSVWCEGDAGDGIGQWIQADFGASRSVSKLKWINGNAASFALFMKGNRASGVTLTFSDGSTETLTELKSSIRHTEVSFPAHTTSSVKIAFDGISKGKEFNDLCLSEAYFYE